MISREYLNKLDAIGYSRGYEFEEKEVLIEYLQLEWNWLRFYWPRNDVDQKTQILNNLAEISYELLQRLTNQSWEDILSSAAELHKNKNAGYSPEDTDSWRNFRECTHFGISAADGCLVRLCDKYRRFFSVYTNPENDKVSESAIDTLRDFAAYSVILIVLLEEDNDTGNRYSRDEG